MPVNPDVTYSGLLCQPAFQPENALSLAVDWMPNLDIRRGGLVAQVTSPSQTQVQTLNWSGGGDVPTGGTFRLSIVGIDGGTYWTPALAYNISNANLKTAVESLLEAAGYYGATVTIGGGACPVDTTVTMGGTALYKNMPVMSYDIASITSAGAATLAITATTAGYKNGLWTPYDDDGAANYGERVAKGIAMYDFRTDYWGRVVYAKAATPSYGTVSGGLQSPQHGVYNQSAPVWLTGVFKVDDLYIWNAATSAWDQYPDANAVTDLGRMLTGAFNVSGSLLSVR